MNGIKTKLLMGVVFLFAFLWGYKKDQIYLMMSARSLAPIQQQSSIEPVDGKNQESKSTPKLPEIAKQNINKLPTLTSPQGYKISNIANRAVGGKPASVVSQGAGNPLATGKNYLPPSNPYSNLSKQISPTKNQASFKEAFGSIKRDSISQKELMKKNAYFRKLSKDLEKMQGDKPSADSAKSADSTEDKSIDESQDSQAIVAGAEQGAATEQNGDIDLEEDFIDGQVDTEEALIDDLDSLIDDTEAGLE